MDSALPGGLGGTYAGSPLACTAALSVLEIIEQEQLCHRAVEIGQLFKDKLSAMRRELPCISEVRQVGAMIAIELDNPRNGEPLAHVTKQLVTACAQQGVIILSCGVKGNVIRFLPPLTIDSETIEKG